MTTDFSRETMENRRQWNNIAKGLKESMYQSRITGSVKIHFKNKIKIKTFSDNRKQKEFVTSRLTKEMPKEVLPIGGKYPE